MIDYQGPGNMTVKNTDFTEFYNTAIDIQETLGYIMETECQPDDGLVQIFTFDNLTISVTDNPGGNKFNAFVLAMDVALYRNIKNFVQNSNFVNYEYTIYVYFPIIAQQNVEVYLYNSTIANITSLFYPVTQIWLNSIVRIENITFENVTDTDQPLFQFLNNFESITIKNLTVSNLSGISTGLNDIIVLGNFPQTVTIIEQLHVFDTTLEGRSAVRSTTELNQIQIINSTFESMNISSSDYIINTGQIKSIIFNTIVLSSIKMTDDIDNSGATLFVSTLDLNSELDTSIQDITIDECEIPFIVFSSVINESPGNITFSFSNINFTNTHFESDRALFSTDGVQLDTSLQISMSNLLFSNISFSRTGTLIE